MQITKNSVPILPVLFLASVLAYPRAFIELKLVILVAIMLHFSTLIITRKIHISKSIIWFYSAFIITGLIAALTGLLRDNSMLAILDGMRLYILWSFLLLFLLTYIKQFNALLIVHYSVLIGALAISAINITQVASSYFNVSILPYWFQKEMLLRVGFHYGYVQMTAHNIGMLFFIIPYLLVTVLRIDSMQEKPWLVWIALGATLLTAALSGRRALWIVIILIPFLMWAIAIATRTQRRIRLYPVFVGLVTSGLLILVLAPSVFLPEDTLRHLALAFSDEDERSIQRYFLIDGFLSMPLVGSGFGGFAGYIRNYDFPWLYELSYHQALFNFGIFGSTILLVALAYAFINAVKAIKLKDSYATHGTLAILIGVTGLLIGAYSNPYLGSFDFLVIIGLLPLIASMAPSQKKETRCYHKIASQ